MSVAPDKSAGGQPACRHNEFSPAHQIPGYLYQDENVFVEEMRVIFQHCWQYVGREEQLAEVGDYFTTQIGRETLIIMRDDTGALRAFHNVCPHRGMQLLGGASNCKAIVCPYHSWTFDYRGRALSVPRRKKYFPDLTLEDVPLMAASVAAWRGFIFANPDPDAEPLPEYLAQFPEYLDNYPESYEDLRQIAQFVFDEPVNWKIIVENYVEDYHFGYVHPGTLKVFDFENVKTMPTGRHIRVLMPYRKHAPDGSSKYPWDESGPSYQGYIFPGTTVQTAKNHVSLFRIMPVSAARTVIEIPVFQTPSQAEQYPLDIAHLKADVCNDMEEDFVICRGLQANVSSSRYKINALALEHELGVAHFQRVWASYLEHAVPTGRPDRRALVP